MKDKQGYSGHCVPNFDLTPENKEELARIIKSDISSEPLQALEPLLIQCAQLQFSIDHADSEDQSVTELKNSLNSIVSGLTKINNQLAGMSANDEHMFDQYHYLANNRNDFLMKKEGELGESGFYVLAEEMLKTAKYYQDSLPSKGKGKPTDHTYSESLFRLIDGLSAIFPSSSVTRSPNGMIHKIIIFWFNNLLDNPIENAWRHIDKYKEQN